jgi:prepilin-type N-terminal cleavage/methylation domain-containing protein
MNKKQGFTLIELLVVIAIIGILSSVVLASLNSARQKSRDAKRVSDIKQLQLALELYFDSNGSYPVTLAPLVTGGQIAQIPTDPVANAAYRYSAIGTGTACTSYHLRATLEDAGHVALDADADAAASTGLCTGSAADEAGTPDTSGTYDVKP